MLLAMNAGSDILLEARDLGRRDGPRWRLQGLDLALRRGEVTALLGLNGAGKSTALALLAGTLRPTTGRVTVAGFDLARQGRRARRRLGLLPEQPPLHPDLTLDENLAFAARLRGLDRRAARAACRRVRQALDLTPFGRRLAGRLSQGLARRAGIAQALIHDPQVLILDEPTAGLDPAHAAELRELIAHQAAERAVLLATHLVKDVETLADHLLVLHQGRMALHEPLAADRNRVRVSFERPPAAPELAAVEGCTGVRELGDGQFLLDHQGDAAALLARLAARPWRLCGFVPHARDLEALLAGLVGSGEAPAP